MPNTSAFPLPPSARGLVLAAVLLLVTAVLPLAASAHVWGQTWAHSSGTSLMLWYVRDCAGSFWQAADAAANSWTNTPTELWFRNTPSLDCLGQPHQGYIDVYAYSGSSPSPAGMAENFTISCYSGLLVGGCWWDYMPPFQQFGQIYASRVWLNESAAAAMNHAAFMLQGVAAHEIGHTLGLAHAGFYCQCGETTGYYSIMDYFLAGHYNTPLVHDANDVNSLYP